jgi:hypothetical protein
MTLETYTQLNKTRFFEFGEVNREYLSNRFPEKHEKLKDINATLLSDANKSYDFNNIIIIFPNNNWIMNKKIVSTHCGNIVDVKIGLDKLGIKFRNGISLLDRRFSQRSAKMLIVENGIAYTAPRISDVLASSFYDYVDVINVKDDDKLNLKNKPIILSGIAVYLLKM